MQTNSIKPFYPMDFSQLELTLAPETGVLTIALNSHPRPSFNLTCLQELDRATQLIKEHKADISCVISKSNHSSVFSLGGDLDMFHKKIESRDSVTLRNYAHLCIDIIDAFNKSFYCKIPSIALVKGQALGGGFEFALAHNFIVADSSAKFGFPEVNFGLYPGMGAYPLFKRKSEGISNVEKLIFSGDSLSAKELHSAGVVDYLLEDSPLDTIIDRLLKKRITVELMLHSRELLSPISKTNLIAITNAWVDAAFNLTPSNLKYMKRLVYFQDKL